MQSRLKEEPGNQSVGGMKTDTAEGRSASHQVGTPEITGKREGRKAGKAMRQSTGRDIAALGLNHRGENHSPHLTMSAGRWLDVGVGMHNM